MASHRVTIHASEGRTAVGSGTRIPGFIAGTTGEPGNRDAFEASRQTIRMAFAVDAGAEPDHRPHHGVHPQPQRQQRGSASDR